MPPSEKHIVCPACRFPNSFGSTTCLTCKAPLPLSSGVTQRFKVGPDGQVETPASGAPELRASTDGLSELLSKRTVAWLVCAPFDPIPLGAVPMLKIGRDKSCELVLPHAGVSRTHCVLRVLGRTVLLEDRSSFGTLVNGQKIESAREVKAGDVIGVGPYELRVAPITAQVDEESDSKAEKTREMKVGSGRLPEVGGASTRTMAMAGRLELVGAAELYQSIEFHRRTGALRVTTPENVDGVLVMVDGRPKAARLGHLQGTAAALAIARLKAGRFELLAHPPADGGGEVGGSLTELLLEAHRREDEEARNATPPPPG